MEKTRQGQYQHELPFLRDYSPEPLIGYEVVNPELKKRADATRDRLIRELGISLGLPSSNHTSEVCCRIL